MRSSFIYLKRLSYTPSVMTEVPFARHRSVPIGGCISVGKPGYGSVLTFTRRSVLAPLTSTESSFS